METEQNRVNGVFDLPAPGRVSGWAIDRADPDATVEVELCRDGELIAKVRADRHRPDLERGGIGTGCYGFSVELDPPMDPAFAFTLTARAITADGASGPLRPVAKATPSDDPTRQLLERIYAQMAELRMDIDGLRDTDTAQTLERIELAQARLDLIAAEVPAPAPQGSGFRAAVTVSLVASMAALGLGLWSVLA